MLVRDVEPVNLESQLLGLAQLERVISAQIQIVGRRRAIAAGADSARPGRRDDGRPALHPEPFVISIDGVRDQRVEWNAGLNVEIA